MRSRPLVLAGLIALTLTGCKKDPTPTPTSTRTFYFRALSGISMGAMGAGMLTAHGDDHLKIDAVTPLGGPIDVAYFLGGFERMQIGGFCPYATLSAMGDADVANGTDLLNAPTAENAPVCPEGTPFLFEHQQSFDHWQFTDDGGDFDRSSYLNLFYDLSTALGNPLYYNPDSPLFPAKGVTQPAYQNAADFCANPVVFPGVGQPNANPIYNAEYNPDGKYNAITFCDGQAPVDYCNDANETYVDFCQSYVNGGNVQVAPDDPNYPQAFCSSPNVTGATGSPNYSQAGNSADQDWDLYYAHKGVYDPCWQHTGPVSFGLAIDYNGNGKRDYYEPVVVNGHERFTDTGTDGCLDAEEDGKGGCTGHNMTGDPNHDNFDPVNNPLGTQGDWKYEKGEPFQDNGLDGVPNTHDYGEGNGKYDDGPNRQNWFSYDLRSNYLGWTQQQRQSLNVYADGGYRDVFNFGLSADIMTSAVHAMLPNLFTQYLNFTDLPVLAGQSWSEGFYAPYIDFTKTTPNMYVRYGDVDATTTQIREGDGDHVGTPAQVADRLETWILWVSHVWQPLVEKAYPQDFAGGMPLPINDVGETDDVTFMSTSLHGLRNFAIALPPGYNDPKNANKRYPVVSLGHGYGMDPDGMAGFAAVTGAFMANGSVIPMIILFPSGKCCFQAPDGSMDCREVDDNGNPLSNDPGYISECNTGTFYVNSATSTTGQSIAYGDSLFEQLDYLDQHYRTMQPQTVPLSEYP